MSKLAARCGGGPASVNTTTDAQALEQHLPGHRREPWLRQLRELRITFDESGEMPRAVFDGGEHADQLLGVGRRARQDLAGMRQRGDRRQGIVQLVRDHADHLLPGRHFLRIDLARELLEQQQPVRQGVQQEAPLRDVIHLRLAGELEREQRVAAAFDGLAQRRGRRGEITREAFALELAALAEQLARGGVAVEHGVGVVGEHQRERRGLDDRVEHELALVEALAFDAQAVAQAVIGVHQLAHLVAGGARDAHAEIAVLDARDAIGERPRHAAPARREHGAGPGDERRDHEPGGDGRHPARGR